MGDKNENQVGFHICLNFTDQYERISAQRQKSCDFSTLQLSLASTRYQDRCWISALRVLWFSWFCFRRSAKLFSQSYFYCPSLAIKDYFPFISLYLSQRAFFRPSIFYSNSAIFFQKICASSSAIFFQRLCVNYSPWFYLRSGVEFYRNFLVRIFLILVVSLRQVDLQTLRAKSLASSVNCLLAPQMICSGVFSQTNLWFSWEIFLFWRWLKISITLLRQFLGSCLSQTRQLCRELRRKGMLGYLLGVLGVALEMQLSANLSYERLVRKMISVGLLGFCVCIQLGVMTFMPIQFYKEEKKQQHYKLEFTKTSPFFHKLPTT